MYGTEATGIAALHRSATGIAARVGRRAVTPLFAADTGTVGLLCWFRGDVVAARPPAFVVTTGVL